jgi:hypothetical protein
MAEPIRAGQPTSNKTLTAKYIFLGESEIVATILGSYDKRSVG